MHLVVVVVVVVVIVVAVVAVVVGAVVEAAVVVLQAYKVSSNALPIANMVPPTFSSLAVLQKLLHHKNQCALAL